MCSHSAVAVRREAGSERWAASTRSLPTKYIATRARDFEHVCEHQSLLTAHRRLGAAGPPRDPRHSARHATVTRRRNNGAIGHAMFFPATAGCRSFLYARGLPAGFPQALPVRLQGALGQLPGPLRTRFVPRSRCPSSASTSFLQLPLGFKTNLTLCGPPGMATHSAPLMAWALVEAWYGLPSGCGIGIKYKRNLFERLTSGLYLVLF